MPQNSARVVTMFGVLFNGRQFFSPKLYGFLGQKISIREPESSDSMLIGRIGDVEFKLEALKCC